MCPYNRCCDSRRLAAISGRTAIQSLQITEGSARLSTRLVGRSASVLVCTFLGAHTVESLRLVRLRMAERLSAGLADAFVHDFRACVLAVDLKDTLPKERIGLLASPGAYVCGPTQVSMVSAWAAAAAEQGAVRRVFTELCPAVEWAELESGLGHPG